MRLGGGVRRDRATWLLYGALGMLGFLLNGLGAVLGPLQRDLGVDRSGVAFYPSLFAAGLLAVGLVGGPVVERVGRVAALRTALVGLAAGAALLAAPGRPATLLGALVLGAAGALLVQLVPAMLTDRHGPLAAAAVGEANAVASTASVAAPLLVAVAVATGLGWRAGYLCPVLPVAVVLVLALRRPARVDVNASVRVAGGASGRGMEPGRLPGRWLDVLLAVSVEFCMVFWSADALSDWQGAHDGQAPAVAALFLVGMAIARAGAGPLTGTGHPLAAVFVAVCVAAGGFAVFWTAPTLAVAGLGLLVTGAGVGLLYPLTVSRAVAAWPQAPDRAAARAALASGLAIGGAPFVLARLADSIGLRAAYLIVPVLLVALAGHAALTLARSTASRHGCPT